MTVSSNNDDERRKRQNVSRGSVLGTIHALSSKFLLNVLHIVTLYAYIVKNDKGNRRNISCVFIASHPFKRPVPGPIISPSS